MKAVSVRSLLGVFRAAAIAAIVAVSSASFAQDGEPIPRNFGFEQRLGVLLPMETPFKDENGNEVQLGDYFGKRPVVMGLVFYKCNGSCLLVRDGIIKTLNAQKKLRAGQDFDVVILSIHPKETPELAKSKKADWLEDYKYPGTDDSWTFLTGTEENIKKVTDQVGFTFTYDPKTDRIAHAAGMMIFTPDGRASEYLLGVTYPALEVQKGILRAAENKIGPKTETILWGCLQYDPKTGKYRLVIENTLKVVGTGFAIIVFASVTMMAFKYRQKPLTSADLDSTTTHSENDNA
jgi:protein SCO1/2